MQPISFSRKEDYIGSIAPWQVFFQRIAFVKQTARLCSLFLRRFLDIHIAHPSVGEIRVFRRQVFFVEAKSPAE